MCVIKDSHKETLSIPSAVSLVDGCISLNINTKTNTIYVRTQYPHCKKCKEIKVKMVFILVEVLVILKEKTKPIIECRS